MYYIEPYFHAWLVMKEDVTVLGPFMNESDASYVCDMLNLGKLKLELGEFHGKEDSQESHSVY